MSLKRKFVFLCLFFVSGACGLIYEITWSRQLVLVFGGTTFAITTVLVCFMGGLAFGSFLAGRLSHKLTNPECIYGVLLIGIGVYCLFIPYLIELASPLYSAISNFSDGSFLWLTVGRVLVCGVTLFLPTTLMGMTLPLLSKAFVRYPSQVGGAVACLYGINTIGAFAGCVIGGFFLLPVLGLSKSILLAAVLNFFAGAIAIILSFRPSEKAIDAADYEAGESKKQKRDTGENFAFGYKSSLAPGVFLWLYAFSGFAAMAYQVAWTRALILAMGASTYAFSVIVACFILGLSLGSLFISPWIRRVRFPLGLAGLMEGVIGLSALFVVPLFGEMPGLVNQLSMQVDAEFHHLLTIEALCVLGLLIVPTLCMGALMPLMCTLYEVLRAQRVRVKSGGETLNAGLSTCESVGAVYAANSVGTIVGAAVAGFVLIPWSVVGMQRTIIIASVLSGIIATVFILSERAWRKMRFYSVLVVFWLVGIVFALFSQPWSRTTMVSGPYLGRDVDTQDIKEILFYQEGIDTTVAVTTAVGGGVSLRVNGKPDASDLLIDLYTQMLSAHIPMLLKPDSRDVCVIGLGSGCTAGTVLCHPVQKVDVIEISGAVIKAAEYFTSINYDVLNDSRVRIHRADGRNFLLMTDNKYDVIISEPSNPWISGVANLFTREFFQIARNSLKPGGIHCQWLNSYSISPDDFANVVKTMSEVFSYIQIWETSVGDNLFVCSNAPIILDLENVYLVCQRPEVRRVLGKIRINDPMQLAHHYITDVRRLEGWLDGKRILVDDEPHLEFSAPHSLLINNSAVIGKILCGAAGFPATSGSPASLLNSEFLSTVDGARKARQYLSKAVANFFDEGDYRNALRFLVQVVRHSPTDLRMFLIVNSGLKGMFGQNSRLDGLIKQACLEITRTAPYTIKCGSNIMEWEFELFWPFARKIKLSSDTALQSLSSEAITLYNNKKFEKAVEKAREIVRFFPYDVESLNRAGIWSLQVESAEAALPYLLKASVIAPQSPVTTFSLSLAYLLKGDEATAMNFLERAVNNGFDNREVIKASGIFDGLKGNKGFQRLLGCLSDMNQKRAGR